MHVSVFRGVVVLTLALFSCSDRVNSGDAWTLNGAPGLDVGGDSESVVAPRDDMSADDVTESRDDGSEDTGRAVDLGRDEDTGQAGRITTTGWYSGAFEHSGFINDSAFDPNPNGQCQPYIRAETPLENWWTRGESLPNANRLITGGDGEIALMRLSGTITEKGEFGHLGAYDREFVVDSGERLACETAAVVGHCLRPFRSDLCIIPAPTFAEPTPAQSRPQLVVTYGGPAGSPVNYVASVFFNEAAVEGRVDVVVKWQLADNADPQLARISDLENLSLEQHQYGAALNIVRYEQLDGWVAYSEADADGWYVSISGVDPDGGPPLQVWGWFDVTEVVALP